MRRTMTPAEHGEYLQKVYAEDFKRIEAVGTLIAERQRSVRALADSPGGQFLLEMWQDQLEHVQRELETCSQDRLSALQREALVYRRWIGYLTQPIEEESADA